MNIHTARTVLLLALLFHAALFAGAQLREQAADFQARITQDLARQYPAAVALFAEANQAREQGDFARAAELYTKVRELAPEFPHAVRRLGSAQLELGQRNQAIATLREARSMDSSPENMSALADALARSLPDSNPTPAELKEAMEWAEVASLRAPRDCAVQLIFTQVSLRNENFPSFEKGVWRLLNVAPNEVATYWFKAVLDVSQQEYSAAHKSLAKARELGLPEEEFQRLSKVIDDAKPLPLRFLPITEVAFGSWTGALLILFAAGWVLSRATLAASKRLPLDGTGRARGLDAVLRRVYAVVLWLCSALYWISLPFVAALVLLGGGGLLYALFALGRIPVKLVAIIAVVMFCTLAALVKSLFVKVQETDPGPRLDLDGNPRFKAVLREVSEKVGTRPVEDVFLTPGTEIAVFERGSMSEQLRGSSRRALLLGAGALDGLRLTAFKAILAHEYGHFSNRDTAGGGFALAVRRSLMIMAQNLAMEGVANWYNPAWLFLNGFYRIFLRLSHGASRLQEVLADRWAAFTYGARALEEGLRHVIGRAVQFDAHVNSILKEVLENNLSLPNLYTFNPSLRPAEDYVQRKVDEALNAEASVYDSHPSPRDRFAMVRALKVVEDESPGDDTAMAWHLLADPEAIQREMTGVVRRDVAASHGISIPAEAETSAASA